MSSDFGGFAVLGEANSGEQQSIPKSALRGEIFAAAECQKQSANDERPGQNDFGSPASDSGNSAPLFQRARGKPFCELQQSFNPHLMPRELFRLIGCQTQIGRSQAGSRAAADDQLTFLAVRWKSRRNLQNPGDFFPYGRDFRPGRGITMDELPIQRDRAQGQRYRMLYCLAGPQNDLR